MCADTDLSNAAALCRCVSAAAAARRLTERLPESRRDGEGDGDGDISADGGRRAGRVARRCCARGPPLLREGAAEPGRRRGFAEDGGV